MTIVSTFSNGFTDTYKGSRAVKAAWAIIDRKTNETAAAGHSLDRVKADKTANGNLSRISIGLPLFDVPHRVYMGTSLSWVFGCAQKHGYTGPRKLGPYKVWAREQNAKRLAALRAKYRIEVVDL